LGEDSGQLRSETRARIAYLAERHPLYRWMTVAEAVRFARSLAPRWSDALLEKILDHFELPRRKRIGRHSNGQRAQVSLALADDGVTEVDLLKRTTRVVLMQTGLTAAGHVNRGLPSPATVDSDAYRSKVKEFLVVRGENQILTLDASGRQQSSFAIPAELRESNFELNLLNDSSAVIQPGRDRLLRIDTTGKIIRRTDYALKHGFVEPEFPPWRVTLSVPSPLAVATAPAVVAPSYFLWIGKDATYRGALTRAWRDFWPALAAICLLGALLSGLVWRRQQRYGLPWTKTWMVFVFLGGLPSLVGYFAHRRWPAVEKCPACGRAVPHDRDACIGCGGEFPEPAPKGTEVLA
jgi:hypothetical protein